MGRNYKTNPHTAHFLRVFHDANGANYSPQASADAEERSAMQFVSGGTSSRTDANAPILRNGQVMVEVSGWKVLTGPGLTTEKQAKWMISIANRPSITDAMRSSLAIRLEQGFDRNAASQFITKYKDTPTAAAHAAREEAINPGPGTTPAKDQATTPRVEDGRYAVEEDGTLKFFRVTNGRKPGYVFLNVQASDEWHPIRNLTRIRAILALIAEDAYGAMVRYGHELGQCGKCGRTLTDEASRAAGIGPICAGK